MTAVLKLSGLPSALLLSETLLTLCANTQNPEAHSAQLDALKDGIEFLRGELDQLQNPKGLSESQISLRVNHLRRIMGQPEDHQPRGAELDYALIVPADFKHRQATDAEMSQAISVWRLASLDLTQGKPRAIDKLVRLSDYLAQAQKTQPLTALWLIIKQWLVSLKLSQVHLEQYVRLLSKLDPQRVARNQANVDLLIYDILSHLRQLPEVTFEAIEWLSHTIRTSSGKGQPVLLLDHAAQLIDLSIELLAKQPDKAKEKLQQADWLLQAGGWQHTQSYVATLLENWDQHASDEQTSQQLDELRQLLRLTSKAAPGSDGEEQAYVRIARLAAIRESRIDLELLKSYFSAYSLSKDARQLGKMMEPLSRISGAMRMIAQEQMSELTQGLEGLIDYVRRSMVKDLNWNQVNAIADCIASVEYYADLLAQDYLDQTVIDSAFGHLQKAEQLLEMNGSVGEDDEPDSPSSKPCLLYTSPSPRD